MTTLKTCFKCKTAKLPEAFYKHAQMGDGRIQRHPCFICGEKAEAHHPNYDAPLDVVWLCPPHHKQAHALMRHYKEAA